MDLNLGFDTVCKAESGSGPGEPGCWEGAGGGDDNSLGGGERGHYPPKHPPLRRGHFSSG